MAGLGLVFGLLVLCSRLFLLLAEDCPWSYSFPCGRLGDLHFPFTDTTKTGCGLYVRGCGNPGSLVEVALGNENKTWFQVEKIENDGLTSKIMVRDNGHQRLLSYMYSNVTISNCSEEELHNVTLPPVSPLMSFEMQVDETLTLYKCNHSIVDNSSYLDYHDCGDSLLYYGLLSGDALRRAIHECTIFQIPTKSLESESEFSIRVTLSVACQKCMHQRGGRCRLDDKGKFRCVFEGQGLGFGNVLTVATAASAAMVVMLMVLGCCFRRKVTFASILFWKGENPTHKKIEIFLKRHEFHLTKRYTYSEIREMTNSFTNKLGQGGYGSVYKGKLHDGCLVAVKVLNNLKGNGEEFINEVASRSQTSHVNIVSLFGFCFQGSKRALVYEFMPNGSLEKFIYEDNTPMVDRQLDCKTLHDIAIGTARGLEYLHKGCNTRILHFDIKPHNILLDVDFCPKISDFGLSKICSRKESIVSMLVARGTVGYIAPEVFSRNFGGVSHKSDVYSFGMMVLEMVGGRRNINVEVECSSEIYFPHWIYKSLEKNQQLALRCIKNENDNEIIRKMILVSLWCIQTDPSARPAMSKVVDMLEGSLESLQIPPKPFLSSPKSSPAHYSTSNL